MATQSVIDINKNKELVKSIHLIFDDQKVQVYPQKTSKNISIAPTFKVEIKLTSASTASVVFIKINKVPIPLIANLGDDKSLFVTDVNTILSSTAYGLNVGNNTNVSILWDNAPEEPVTSKISFIESNPAPEEDDEDEDDGGSHDHESLDPRRNKIEEQASIRRKNAEKTNTTIGELKDSQTSKKNKTIISIKKTSDTSIQLGIAGSLFFELKSPRDLKSVKDRKLTDEGKKLLSFLRSKGYQITEVKYGTYLTAKLVSVASTYEGRRRIEAAEALISFERVASVLLTEPYLYARNDSEKELARIQELFGDSVVPIFYNFLEVLACGENHLNSSYNAVEKEEIAAIVNEKFKEELKANKNAQERAKNKNFAEIMKEEAIFAIGASIGMGVVALVIAPVAISTFLFASGASALIWAGSVFIRDDDGESINLNNKRVKQGVESLGEHFLKEKNRYSKETLAKIATLAVLDGKAKEISDQDTEARRKVAADYLARARAKTGNGKAEINGAINMITGKVIGALPAFKEFEDMAYKIGASSALNLILKPSKTVTKERSYEQPTNLYSEEILGQEAAEYLYFLLAFPWYEGVGTFGGDTSLAAEVFALGDADNKERLTFNGDESNFSSLTYNSGKRDYKQGDGEIKTLFDLVINNASDNKDATKIGNDFYNSYFVNNEATLKANQEKKINFLLALRDALVQEVIAANATEYYEDKTMRKFVEKYNAGSVFKIADTTAYPDIELGQSITNDGRALISPSGYYFNPSFKQTRNEDKKRLKRIIEKSKSFKDDIREHVVTNMPLELGGRSLSIDSAMVLNSNQTGTSSENTNSVSPEFTSNLKTESFDSFSVYKLPATINSFKDGKTFKEYVEKKHQEIINAEKEVQTLSRAMGEKNFFDLETEKKVTERYNRALRSNQNDKVKALKNVLGLSQRVDYNNPDDLTELFLDANENQTLKLGMQRAFPTFRFYIVEEDSIYSDKLTVYDDFFSYASVISFNVASSRELPAATAQIVLQNVSGVLDGSKKEVVRDIDIDSKKIISDRDDDVAKSIESIVLRPGVNAQLRAGYTETCMDLDILISGRITEVQYSNDGMTTNITLQSYGVELDQKIEANLSRNNSNNIFYSTHQLLGSLILSPQLKHFGRIKTGRIFQNKENKSPALDSRIPANDSWFTYYYSDRFTRTLADNAHLLAYAIILGGVFKWAGGSLISRFAFTRTIAGGVARAGARVAGGLSNVANTGIGRVFTFLPNAFIKTGRGTAGALNRFVKKGGSLNSKELLESERAVANSILQKINSNTVTTLNKFTVPEQKLINDIRGAIVQAVPGTAKDTVGSLGLTQAELITAFGGREVALIEAQVIANAIRAEGMAFSLTNFTYTGLGNAVRLNAMETAERLAATTVTAASKTGFGGAAGRFGQQLLPFGRSILQTTGIAIGAGGVASVLGLYLDAVYNAVDLAGTGINNVWEYFFKEEEDDTLRILLSPQDDNLFIPAAKTYLRDKRLDKGIVSSIPPLLNSLRFGKGMLNVTTLTVSDILFDYFGVKLENDIEERFREFKSLFDTRLNTAENENYYQLKGQTIFSVFHEMSLRHPGFVYGARPYGDSMEYRMFFGNPNQRYWAEDISMIDVLRVNKIFNEYTEPKNNGLLTLKTCKEYYAAETKRSFEESNKLINKGTKEKITPAEKEKLARIEVTQIALQEYIKKSKKRFVPFRKIHLMDSSMNIVANNIIVSGHDVINTVSVNYSKLNEDGESIRTAEENDMYSIELSANTALTPEQQKPKTFSSDNVVGPAAAYRYALGQLMYGARNMYQGSVLTLGETKVHPWDVLVINDDVNRMYGPVEVKAVRHMFSHETGFLTDIEVNALVSCGDDSMTYPSIVSSIIGEAKQKIYNEFASRAEFEEKINGKNNKYYEEMLKNLIDETFKEEAEEEVKNSLKIAIRESLEKEMSEAKLNGRPFFLRDVLERDISIPDSVSQDLKQIGYTLIEGGGLYALIKSIKASNYKIRAGMNLRNPIGVGFGLYMAGSAAFAFGSKSIVKNVEGSLNSGRLGKNLFRPVLMSKASNQSIIEVYPLVKDGKPLVAGGFESVPASQSYKNVLGNIYSDISDGIEGYLKYKDEIEKRGAGAVYTFDRDFIQRKQSAYEGMTNVSGPGGITKVVYRGLVKGLKGAL